MRFAASRSKPAPIYARGNIKWRQWSSHSNVICNQRYKNRIELRTQEQPLVAKHIGGTFRAWNDRSRNRRTQTRYLSSPAAATLHGKTQGFVLRLPPQNIAHATFMQPLQCVSQHPVAKPAPIYARGNIKWRQWSSHSNAICNQRYKNCIELRTQTQPLVAKNTWEEQFAHETTAAATAAQTRYLSSPAAATLHGKTQGFVLRLPPQNIAHATFIYAHSFYAHSFKNYVTTSLRHLFPSSPLPFVTTSLPHRFPMVPTSLPHHSPSSPLPFVTTSLPHHFPSSPPPIVTTSHRHHLPSSPPCVIPSYSMWCTTLHQGQSFCDVLLCNVKSHTTLHQGQFFCDVLLYTHPLRGGTPCNWNISSGTPPPFDFPRNVHISLLDLGPRWMQQDAAVNWG